mgnify:CR=1 FL=1
MKKTITDATITPMLSNGTRSPFMTYKGETPKIGEILAFKMKNGTTYTGTVNEAETVDGLTVVGFKGPLTPSK